MAAKATDKAQCVHKWSIDSHNVGTCSNCHEVRQFPQEKGEQVVVLTKGKLPAHSPKKEPLKHRRMLDRNAYYEANRDAILADIMASGRDATCSKWKIPRGTIGKLCTRWYTPARTDGRLPPLPDFSPAWEPNVQLVWLMTYRELVIQGRKEG